MTSSRTVKLMPILTPSTAPQWPDSVWVGQVCEDEVAGRHIALSGADGFNRARILVRSGPHPRGFVELRVTDGSLDIGELRSKMADLPTGGPSRPADTLKISVVLCTRNRPQQLGLALESLRRLDYDDFEVVVVDNGSDSRAAHRIVDSIADNRVRVVDAPVPGLSRARNVGLCEASFDVVAFTDDDVVVDAGWLRGIATGFTSNRNVACVTGLVPSAELVSPAQAYFDERVSWARNCARETFSVKDARVSEPMFPFQVGRFGTGANFALRRSIASRIGGFDEGLGAGSPTGGGEDIDMFLRVLLAGHQLVYEPSAIVWHRHRPDSAGLTQQIRGYGTGLGAWMTQLALQPRTAAMIARRSVHGIAHLRRLTRNGPHTDLGSDLTDLGRRELLAVLGGPLALARARLAGARRRPLARASVRRPAEEARR